jgi:hypothetical protein
MQELFENYIWFSISRLENQVCKGQVLNRLEPRNNPGGANRVPQVSRLSGLGSNQHCSDLLLDELSQLDFYGL